MSTNPTLPTTVTTDYSTGIGLGYAVAIAIGILILISSIMLASYVCIHIKSPPPQPPPLTPPLHHHHDIVILNGTPIITTATPSHHPRLGIGVGLNTTPSLLGLHYHHHHQSGVVNRLPGPISTMKTFLSRPILCSSTHGCNDTAAVIVLGQSKRLPKPNTGPCSICLSNYKPNEKVRCMPDCNHCFHLVCIDQWLRMNPTCPLCRTSSDTPLSQVVVPMVAVHGR